MEIYWKLDQANIKQYSKLPKQDETTKIKTILNILITLNLDFIIFKLKLYYLFI